MRRWQAFKAVCGHLRAGLFGGVPPDAASQASWEELIASSSHHFVTPALAWCVRQDRDLPDDVRGYLDAVLQLNTQRNELLIDTLRRVVAVLNAIDLEPVLLKGAAQVIAGVYPAPGLRVMGDLDLLIPNEQAELAQRALREFGFTADGPPLPDNHHHLPMLCDPETGAGVELHTDVLHRRSELILPLAWFLEKTRVSVLADARFRLLDATRSIGHAIVHDQLDHEGYRRKRLELRQLLDVAVLRAKDESSIDWAELDRRFCDANVGQVLATYLRFAEEFFGQSAPQLSRAPRADAVGGLRDQLRTDRLGYIAKIFTNYVAARRRDPFGVFHLFRPATWRGKSA